jgi:hypothetical protein
VVGIRGVFRVEYPPPDGDLTDRAAARSSNAKPSMRDRRTPSRVNPQRCATACEQPNDGCHVLLQIHRIHGRAAPDGFRVSRIDQSEVHLFAPKPAELHGVEVVVRVVFRVLAVVRPREPLDERIGEQHQVARQVGLAPCAQMHDFVG